MNITLLCLLTSLVFPVVLSAAERAGSPEESARAAFEASNKLFDAYDAAGSDIYTDDATIRNLRRYWLVWSWTRELKLTGKEYKALVRKVVPLAKARGDRTEYRNCRYRVEGNEVVVEGERYSRLKDYTSPYRARMKTDASGKWRIHDEYSESRP